MDPNNRSNGSTNPQCMQYPVLAPGATARATAQLANGSGGLQNGNGPSGTRPDGARLLNQLKLSSENSEEQEEEEFEQFRLGPLANGNAMGSSNSGPGPVRRASSQALPNGNTPSRPSNGYNSAPPSRQNGHIHSHTLNPAPSHVHHHQFSPQVHYTRDLPHQHLNGPTPEHPMQPQGNQKSRATLLWLG